MTEKYNLGAWPTNEVEYINHCPLCGAEDVRSLHNDLTDIIFLCAPGKWNLNQCNSCGVAFVDPRPSRKSIYLAYSDYYTHHQSELGIEHGDLSFLRRLSRSLGNGYRNWRYGTDTKPSTNLGVVAAYMMPGTKKAIDVSLRYLPFAGGKQKRLLDVGFGGGMFLERAASLGWDVYGVDPDPVSVSNALVRGLNVRQGGIEAYLDQAGSFDYITISHVIEHVHDPLETLCLAYKLLKPGGRLWLDTPNIDSFGYARFGKYWLGVDSPRHLFVFGWKSMRYLLKRSGFTRWKYVSRSEASLVVYPLSDQVKKGALAGVAPFEEEPLPAGLTARIAAIGSIFRRNRAEFITVIAEKPLCQ